MKHLPLALGLALTACGSDSFNSDDSGTPPGDGGGDAGVVLPPGCDLGKDPKDSPACVADGVGLFVSVKGSDSNPGTKEAPLATLDAALGKSAPRIYVCAGDYTSNATIKASVGVYGGFDCTTWAYADTNRPRIKGSLAVKGATGVALMDLEVDAPDRDSKSGLSSVALAIAGSQMVVLHRLKLVAGNGGSGADGTLTQYSFSTPLQGGSSASGAKATVETCPDGATSTGGAGAGYPSNGDNGAPGSKTNGGTSVACDTSGTGGSVGDPGGPGGPASGAMRLGALSPDGWMPEPGQNGPAGKPGQGGGGGSAGYASGSTKGSGGGAGGCGGAGGSGGKGGGASVGLAVVASDVMIRESAIIAKNGGSGGNGVGGQQGQQLGGSPGMAILPACTGGFGGYGGDGGSGGGGAGGVSVAIFFKGTPLDVDGLTQTGLQVGAFGTKGTGLAPASDGIDGVAMAVLECKGSTCQ